MIHSQALHYSHFALGDLNRSHGVGQGLIVTLPLTPGNGNDPHLFSHHPRPSGPPPKGTAPTWDSQSSSFVLKTEEASWMGSETSSQT